MFNTLQLFIHPKITHKINIIFKDQNEQNLRYIKYTCIEKKHSHCNGYHLFHINEVNINYITKETQHKTQKLGKKVNILGT